ncbi:hypothetical protein BDP55DRAFT_635879 [Colletotrichum godetiae]|uniref:Uncharacterized protein n=1 Tax=Colletotrichum godetiae TaxID=1209918 RepID=A0AAJ0ACK9_9PEZI|nr:uncharacterized protein BDP55DRAFT_635879 [Colletotrichum godetiae]KAK1671448.1 hypothetical protein BDP55DRAFT_635879 [Colletotrichum godetiae]
MALWGLFGDGKPWRCIGGCGLGWSYTDRRGVWLRHDIRETTERLSSSDALLRIQEKYRRGDEEDEEDGDQEHCKLGFGKHDAARVSSVSFLSIHALSLVTPHLTSPSGRYLPVPLPPLLPPAVPVRFPTFLPKLQIDPMKMEMEVAKCKSLRVAPALDIIPQQSH